MADSQKRFIGFLGGHSAGQTSMIMSALGYTTNPVWRTTKKSVEKLHRFFPGLAKNSLIRRLIREATEKLNSENSGFEQTELTETLMRIILDAKEFEPKKLGYAMKSFSPGIGLTELLFLCAVHLKTLAMDKNLIFQNGAIIQLRRQLLP